MEALFTANLHFLGQVQHLINDLKDDVYKKPIPTFYNSSIGAHLRHCFDHYESFIAGYPSGKIDYDARARDPKLEICTETAHGRVSSIISKFETMKQAASPPDCLTVKMDCGTDESWEDTSVGRELQFLVSHTVHHLAMISSICITEGIETPENFGVAPSTIRHKAACAGKD